MTLGGFLLCGATDLDAIFDALGVSTGWSKHAGEVHWQLYISCGCECRDSVLLYVSAL